MLFVVLFVFIFSSDDHTRVVLSLLDGVPGSDYINATHIRVRDIEQDCVCVCVCECACVCV